MPDSHHQLQLADSNLRGLARLDRRRRFAVGASDRQVREQVTSDHDNEPINQVDIALP
jgi:hypothetical protein